MNFYEFMNYTETPMVEDNIDGAFMFIITWITIIFLLHKFYMWRKGNCKKGVHDWTHLLLGRNSNYCKVCGKKKGVE